MSHEMNDRPLRNLPRITPESAPYWEGCREGKFLLQKCSACGTYQFYPRALCSACGSSEIAWAEASGQGEVVSFTVMQQAISPGYKDDVPYVVAIIRLAEGPTMMSNVVGCDPDAAAIGMPVTVGFKKYSDAVTVPVFSPAKSN